MYQIFGDIGVKRRMIRCVHHNHLPKFMRIPICFEHNDYNPELV